MHRKNFGKGGQHGRKIGAGRKIHLYYGVPCRIENTEQIVYLDIRLVEKKFKENSTIEILYDPSSPDNIYIPSNPPYAEREARVDIIWGVAGIVLSVIFFNLKNGSRSMKGE